MKLNCWPMTTECSEGEPEAAGDRGEDQASQGGQGEGRERKEGEVSQKEGSSRH